MSSILPRYQKGVIRAGFCSIWFAKNGCLFGLREARCPLNHCLDDLEPIQSLEPAPNMDIGDLRRLRALLCHSWCIEVVEQVSKKNVRA